jgi:hypothetical protein
LTHLISLFFCQKKTIWGLFKLVVGEHFYNKHVLKCWNEKDYDGRNEKSILISMQFRFIWGQRKFWPNLLLFCISLRMGGQFWGMNHWRSCSCWLNSRIACLSIGWGIVEAMHDVVFKKTKYVIIWIDFFFISVDEVNTINNQ